MKNAYKFRLYPTKHQISKLDLTIEVCRRVYNMALEDRQVAYKTEGISRSYEDQAAALTAEKKINPSLKAIFSQVLQDTLRRLDKAYKAFYRRVKAGEDPGYPRFKGKGRYRSFTYLQAGFKLEGSKLSLSKIGDIRVFKHRDIEGTIKTCTIKKERSDRWYAILVTEIDDVIKIEPKTAIGVDLGLKNEIVTSDGETYQYPKYYYKYEKKLAAAQNDLSRKKNGSNNRAKARVKVARIHQKIIDLRVDFLHKVYRTLVDKADLIVFENLNIRGMVQNHHLAKAINDSAWAKLILMTVSKAEKAGKTVKIVDARYTSQRCSVCGNIVPKDLSESVHDCPSCGLSIDRDLNAAKNILTLGLRDRASRDPTPTLKRSKQARSMKQEAISL
jgi:putative transposase